MTLYRTPFGRVTAVSALLFIAAPLVIPRVARAQSDTTDPRAHLKPGLYDAGVAAKGLDLVGHVNKADIFMPNSPGGLRYANSDLAFGGHYVYQGNFSGLQIWDISDPSHPTLASATPCFTEQGDVSLAGHLLFVSSENRADRLDCGMQGIPDSVSKERMLGIRIFDVSDPHHPKQVADVQTCRGSHTNTLVPDPINKGIVYIYVSGLAPPRSSTEMPGCVGGDVTDPNSVLFRIEAIRVPLAHPEQAKIVSSPRIFNNLAAPTDARHGRTPIRPTGRRFTSRRGSCQKCGPTPRPPIPRTSSACFRSCSWSAATATGCASFPTRSINWAASSRSLRSTCTECCTRRARPSVTISPPTRP